MKIAKIFGIDILFENSVFMLIILISLNMFNYLSSVYRDISFTFCFVISLLCSLILLSSIVAHELGHSLVSIYYGCDVKKIHMFILGGCACLEKDHTNPVSEFRMAIAGPIVSFLLFVFFAVVCIVGMTLGWSPILMEGFQYGCFLNFILMSFNCIPIFPLDGGRILRSVIWDIYGDLFIANKITFCIGYFLILLLILLSIYLIIAVSFFQGIWLMIMTIFIGIISSIAHMTYLKGTN